MTLRWTDCTFEITTSTYATASKQQRVNYQHLGAARIRAAAHYWSNYEPVTGREASRRCLAQVRCAPVARCTPKFPTEIRWHVTHSALNAILPIWWPNSREQGQHNRQTDTQTQTDGEWHWQKGLWPRQHLLYHNLKQAYAQRRTDDVALIACLGLCLQSFFSPEANWRCERIWSGGAPDRCTVVNAAACEAVVFASWATAMNQRLRLIFRQIWNT